MTLPCTWLILLFGLWFRLMLRFDDLWDMLVTLTTSCMRSCMLLSR